MSKQYEVNNKGNKMSIQSSGKLINQRNGNFEFWSATFTFFGVSKSDGKRLVNTPFIPAQKVK